MTARSLYGLLGICLLFLNIYVHADENWPQWRGPTLNGTCTATGLPDTWSETENILWKTELPSWSGSTPIIWGGRIFLMSPSKVDANSSADSKEKAAGGPGILLLCISKPDGKILWERELDTGNKLNLKGNNSSPSPVTDGTHVWAVTGNGTVTALTMDGEAVWTKNLQKEYGNFGINFGYASSPLLYKDRLILEVIQGYTTKDPSYVMACDTLTGNVLWRVERPTDAVLESPDAYTTPTLLQYEDKTQIIISGGDYVTGHDPDTGKEIWRGGGLNPRKFDRNRFVVSPVAVDGMIYVAACKKPVVAYRAGGTGDCTATHIAWTWDKAYAPDVPTPACDGVYFYMVGDQGVVTCLNAKTGEVIWGSEHTAPGIVSASPLLADGKLYITNEEAVTTVLAAGPAYKVIATNTLPSEGKTLSSFAVSGSNLFLRTPTHLYCIGKK
ncbi:MAG TPA: PQQ-binding-like beta-propeller repeat protein [Candidatus Hydrogenedentes bacterium]|nr:PQQ-binding-like beta-propeller repeat protein [Candidatus Hydrogenedentota bacterium]